MRRLLYPSTLKAGIVYTGNGAVVYDRQIEHLIALEQRKRNSCLVAFLNSSTVDKFCICSRFCQVINFIRVLRISSDCTEQGSIIAGVCKPRLLTGRTYSNLLKSSPLFMLKTFYSWSGVPEKEDAFTVDGGFLKGIGRGERRVIWGIELTPITSASTVNQLVWPATTP